MKMVIDESTGVCTDPPFVVNAGATKRSFLKQSPTCLVVMVQLAVANGDVKLECIIACTEKSSPVPLAHTMHNEKDHTDQT
jgi:hypothetical protein